MYIHCLYVNCDRSKFAALDFFELSKSLVSLREMIHECYCCLVICNAKESIYQSLSLDVQCSYFRNSLFWHIIENVISSLSCPASNA